MLLAKGDYLPNYDALVLSPGVGWWLLGCVVGLTLFLFVHREIFRRLMLRMEDPRPAGIFRILFGIAAMMDVDELADSWTYLFTDEGIFSTPIAQHYRAKQQFTGFGDGHSPGEPLGFLNFEAVIEWAKGPNYSLLLLDSSPTFFWIYITVFNVAMVMLIVGFQTRWVKWVAWGLFLGVIHRNTLFWEGTENVYRNFFFLLCLTRCGNAFSVDNWLRWRRLRRQGRLSEPGTEGEGAGAMPSDRHPRGLEPMYMSIPAWPRMLVILQIATLYVTTGSLKNGPVWHRGDAFYYSFNLDHFYRLPPQELSAIFGTTLFRVNTWVTHYWEACFPLVILGLLLRFARREGIPKPSGWHRTLSRAGLGGAALCFLGMVIYAYPVHYKAPEGGVQLGPWHLDEQGLLVFVQWAVAIATPIVLAGLVALYRMLDRRRDDPERWFDLDFVSRWILGRRLWLGLGVIFHVHLIVMMNIGWFTPGLLAGYVMFLNGGEIAAVGNRLLRFVRLRPESARPIPQADPRLRFIGHRDGHQLPLSALLTSLGLALVGVVRMVQTAPDIWERVGKEVHKHAKIDLPEELTTQIPEVHFAWFIAFIVIFAVVITVQMSRGRAFNPWFAGVLIMNAWLGSLLHERGLLGMEWTLVSTLALSILGSRLPAPEPAKPRPDRDPVTQRLRPPWAYGPVGRVLCSCLVIYHCLGVAIWLLPDKNSMDTFRMRAREPFKDWLRYTNTTQGWGMFAPNPPRSNMFLRAVAHVNGESYDLNVDVYACFQEGATKEVCDAVYPVPWIFYSRHRKMNRRTAGSEGGKGAWYQKWHARYLCRQWALSHDGELPDEIELIKVSYPIPSPEHVWEHGAYDPAHEFRTKGTQKSLHTTKCREENFAQLPNWMRERHGLPLVPEDEIHTWDQQRCRKWENELRKRAEEAGEVLTDEDDPRFIVCPDAPRKSDERREAKERREASKKKRSAASKRPREAKPGIKATPLD